MHESRDTFRLCGAAIIKDSLVPKVPSCKGRGTRLLFKGCADKPLCRPTPKCLTFWGPPALHFARAIFTPTAKLLGAPISALAPCSPIMDFNLVSDYQPAGDQGHAIAE